MKLSHVTIRKFSISVFGVYFGVLALIIMGAALSGALNLSGIGNVLFYFGIAIFIFGFLFMGMVNREPGTLGSSRIRNDEQFKEWRKQERPVELVTWAIILAGALLAGTGYVLLRFMNFG